jgi:hypothetical protein
MLARTFAQVHHLLSTSFSTTSVIASIAIWVVCANKVAPFAVAPFARWVERLEARRHGFRGFDGLQVLALVAVEVSSLVWYACFFSTHVLCLIYATVNDKIILDLHCSKAPISAVVFYDWSI